MFESTIGRLIPGDAKTKCPPFALPDVIKGDTDDAARALTVAKRNAPYAQRLHAGGGTAPYAWTTLRGDMPPGLVISSDGLIGGTPTEAGAWEFTLSVKDSNGATNSARFTIVVE